MTLLLKSFLDVVSFHGNFTYRISEAENVPEPIVELWRGRGYQPALTGVAYVKFDFSGKEYKYPAAFWSE